jgi:N-sulfoglucosamine sulfohydrolase
MNLAARFCLAVSLAAAPAQEAASPLNLLLVTADDMNADSSGWMGNKAGATPNLDAFATTCMRFEQGHVVAPICQPCRSALMTGRVPHRNGALGFDPIRKDVPTLMEILRERGYFAACLNKVPHTAVKPGVNPWDLTDNASGKNPKALGQRTREAIQAAADAKKPFFVNANITDPHRPFPGSAQEGARQGKGKGAAGTGEVTPYDPKDVAVPSFLEDLPAVRKEVAQYLTGVRRFDQSFGEILQALRDSGCEERTVILFLSDHGMSFPFSKATVYRNGTRSPFLLRWPGMGEPKAFKSEMVASVDLLPTLLELLSVPVLAGLDGRSLLPLVRGEKQEGRDHVITYVNTVSSGASFPQRCVRTLTRSYLWQAWPDGKTRLRVEAFHGLTYPALEEAAKSDPAIKARFDQLVLGAREQFFDLERDPDERRSLVDDPGHREEIDRLKRLLLAEMERTADPQLEAFRKTLAR